MSLYVGASVCLSALNMSTNLCHEVITNTQEQFVLVYSPFYRFLIRFFSFLREPPTHRAEVQYVWVYAFLVSTTW